MTALHNYRLGGSRALKEGISRATGTILVNKDVLEAADASDDLRKIANRMDKVDKVHKTGKAVTSLVEIVPKALPPFRRA